MCPIGVMHRSSERLSEKGLRNIFERLDPEEVLAAMSVRLKHVSPRYVSHENEKEDISKLR